MENKALLDRNHVIGLLISVITVGSLIFFSSRNLLQSIYSTVDGFTLLVLLFVLYMMRSLLAVPLSPITVFIGYHYGFPEGVAIGLAGSTTSCVLPYVIGRYIRTSTGIIGFLSRYGEQIVSVTGTVRGVLAARVSPLPTDTISYGAGLSDVPLFDYMVGTVVGLLPWTITLVLFGDSLQQLVLQDIEVGPQLLISTALIGFLLVAPSLYKWNRDDDNTGL